MNMWTIAAGVTLGLIGFALFAVLVLFLIAIALSLSGGD